MGVVGHGQVLRGPVASLSALSGPMRGSMTREARSNAPLGAEWPHEGTHEGGPMRGPMRGVGDMGMQMFITTGDG